MKLYRLGQAAFTVHALTLVCLLPMFAHSQASQSVTTAASAGSVLPNHAAGSAAIVPGREQGSPVITLEPPTGWELQVHKFDGKGNLLPEAPSNFRRLGEARVGQMADLQTLTLRFNETTKITGISVTKDFRVEQGGSCVEGNVYDRGTTCRLLVRFTPQGPGNRLGKLTVANSSSATPMGFGLGGYSYTPVVSFIPSIITTVPGTYPSSVGLLNGAKNLTVDGGDVLYVADTGNNRIRKIDSSGVITNITPLYATPASVAVDSFGDIWWVGTSGSQYYFDEGAPWGSQTGFGYAGTSTTCTVSAPCAFASVGMNEPADISIDSSNNLFMEEGTIGALEMPVGAWSGGNGTLNLWHLSDEYAYASGSPAAFAVSPTDDELFTSYIFTPSSTCYIVEEPLYGAEGSSPNFTRVAGADVCGFSGDGGLGADAEIGSAIGQMAFDAAGDLYFTDTNNQRVRRVDYSTGVIRTIAGTGTAGYTGDGNGGVVSELSGPTGVAVDSQGQVYIISSAASGQVIRKLTATGIRNLGSVPKGTKSAASVLVVTNTGNANLQITNTAFTGADPGDFSIDPNTTSCLLSPGAILYSGQTCQVGFIFTPSAAGNRTANFVLLDNTINSTNVVNLIGTGTLPVATFKITSPSNGASYTSGTAVSFKVSVTSGSGPAPTGTVQFKVDGANYGSAVTISSGTASTTVTGLTQTSHTLSATYSGDSNYAAAGPISVGITITAAIAHQPTVTMSPLAKTSMSCMPQTFNVTVSGTTGMMPTGMVHLTDNGGTVSAATLVNGKAALSSPPLLAGTHTLAAQYSGDAHNPPASSPALVETISLAGGCNQPLDAVGTR